MKIVVIRGRENMVVIRGGAKEMVLMGAKMLVIWGEGQIWW